MSLGLNNKYVYDFLIILFLLVIVIVFYYFEEIKRQYYLRGAHKNLKKIVN
jgi:preprotein translocase subunit YajC